MSVVGVYVSNAYDSKTILNRTYWTLLGEGEQTALSFSKWYYSGLSFLFMKDQAKDALPYTYGEVIDFLPSARLPIAVAML